MLFAKSMKEVEALPHSNMSLIVYTLHVETNGYMATWLMSGIHTVRV